VIVMHAPDTSYDVSRYCQILEYPRGSSIYFERDPVRHWFEVVSGIVRTCRFLSDGHRQLTGFFYAGDVFGVEDGVHSESAETVTEAVVRRHARIDGHAALFPPAQPNPRAIALQQALDSAKKCLFLFGHKTANARVAAFLVAMAERLYPGVGVQLPMSRTDIADHLGLTIHTVSRTISELARRGLIRLDGPRSIRIVDGANLRALAGQDAEAPPPQA
jgi:CRP-like cAMP-binding protein